MLAEVQFPLEELVHLHVLTRQYQSLLRNQIWQSIEIFLDCGLEGFEVNWSHGGRVVRCKNGREGREIALVSRLNVGSRTERLKRAVLE